MLSHMSLISALHSSACLLRLRRVVLPARCLHRPDSALPASCHLHAFPCNHCIARENHGSFLLLAALLDLWLLVAFCNAPEQVFRPTMEEFSLGFEKFLLTIEESLKTYGICKVRGLRGRHPPTCVLASCLLLCLQRQGSPGLPSDPPLGVQIIPPEGWATFDAYGPTAAVDGPLGPAFPKIRAISQAPAGRLGVLQLGIIERKAPLTAEQFRQEALKRQGGCYDNDSAARYHGAAGSHGLLTAAR